MDINITFYVCASCGMFQSLSKADAAKCKFDTPVPLHQLSAIVLTDKRLCDYLYSPCRRNHNVCGHPKQIPDVLGDDATTMINERAISQVWYPYASDDIVLQSARLRATMTFYYLHISYVVDYNTNTPKAPLCPECRRELLKGKMPHFNIGNGYDFGHLARGDHINIFDLTEAERIVTAVVVRFQTCIKFKHTEQIGIQGHMICFEGNGPSAIASKLPRTDIKGILFTAFICSKQSWEDIQGSQQKRKAFFERHRSLCINADRVYAYLKCKQRLDPIRYGNIDIEDTPAIRQSLEDIPNQLLNSALVTHDERIIDLDRVRTDDVSRQPETQHSTPDTDEPVTDSGFDAPEDHFDSSMFEEEYPYLDPVFVCPEVQTKIGNTAEVLHAVQNATNPEPAQDGHHPVFTSTNPIPITVQRLPVDEISHNDDLLLGVFHYLFLLGQGVKEASNRLTQREIKHLLYQHDGRFAKDSTFIFTLFNQMQRYQANVNANVRIHSDADFIQRFTALANQPNFQEQLQDAIDHPNDPQSQKLAHTLTSTVRMSGANIPWTQAERSAALPKMMAMMHYAGPFSLFVTIAPSDVDSALVLRLSRNVDSADITLSQWELGEDFEFVLPSLNRRRQILATNPASAAMVYKQLIEAFFAHLVNLPAEHTMRGSQHPVVGRQDGIFGKPIIFAGVTEMQGRQSAHLHAVITTDMSPIVIREILDNPEERQKLVARMDSIVQAWVPLDAEYVAKAMSKLPREESTVLIRDGRYRNLEGLTRDIQLEDGTTMSLDDSSSDEDFINHLNMTGFATAFKVNNHSHSQTCRKTDVGRWRCRMALPTASWNSNSQFLQLKMHVAENGKMTPVALEKLESAGQPDMNPLLAWTEKRIIVLQLSRPHRRDKPIQSPDDLEKVTCDFDGKEEQCFVDIGVGENSTTVAFSPLLTALLGCNTCVDPLGGMGQSKAVGYYLFHYMTKDGGKLANVLSLAQAAHNYIQRFPSTADDAGSPIRASQHLLTRLLTTIMKHQEYSAQTASLALLGLPSNVFSHEFSYCHIWPAMMYVEAIHNNNPPVQVTLGTTNHPTYDNDITAADSDEDLDDRELPLTREDDDDLYEAAGTATIVTSTSGAVEAVTDNHHYHYRGEELAGMSLYEYRGIVNIVKVNATSEATDGAERGNSGRKSNKRIAFAIGHPERGKREQALRSKPVIPILSGKGPPRHPGPCRDTSTWRKKMNRFAAYVLTLHMPWDLTTGAPPVPLDYPSLNYWINHMFDDPDPKAQIIAHARLFWIRILSQNVSIGCKMLKTISSWRSRYATQWSQVERMEADQPDYDVIRDADDETVAELALRELQEVYELLHPDAESNESARSAEMAAQYLNDCFQGSPALQPIPTGRRDEERPNEIAEVHNNACSLIGEADDSDDDEPTNEPSVEAHPSNQLPGDAVTDAISVVSNEPDQDLNQEQNNALITACTWFNELNRYQLNPAVGICPDQLKMLILGAAGTGKSHFVKRLVSRLGSDAVICGAPTGIAASGLPNGQTLHSLFVLAVNKKNSSTSASQIAAKAKFSKAKILVIDEVSMLTDTVFGDINKRLQNWQGNQEPFGGIGIIMMGDFFQLPAVGRSLLQAMEDRANFNGRLFTSFKRIEFKQQMRAAEDEGHAKALNTFRNPSLSLRPIHYSNLLLRMKVLKQSECMADPKWAQAKIIVTDNNKRMAINRSRAIEFAKSTGQPVIAWIHKLGDTLLSSFKAVARQNNCSPDELLRTHPELVNYFVSGAPAIIGENIAVSNGLTNGTTCRYHSLTLDSKACNPEMEWFRIGLAEPGEIVWLTALPKSVNVELPSSTNWSPNQSLSTTSHVIPLLLSRNPSSFDAKTVKRIKSRMGTKASGKMKYHDFGVDLAFSLTYHKVQGQTLPAVILDFNSVSNCAMSVAAFYVGVSRVRKFDDIRIMPINARVIHQLEHAEFAACLVKWFKSQHA